MEINLGNLEYPGLFAYLGDKGYVEVYRTGRPPHELEYDEEKDEYIPDPEINIVVEGADENGKRLTRLEFSSLEALFGEYPNFHDLEFLPRRDENGRHKVKIFDKLEKEILHRLAIKVEIETPWGQLHKVSNVKFKFPNEVWADLANKGGELLPPCCASISAIRDCFISAQREDGSMRVEDMQRIAVNKTSHDFEESHPVTLVAKVYDLIEPYVDIVLGPHTENPLDPKDACDMIRDFAWDFSWDSIRGHFKNSFEGHLKVAHGIYTVLPALNTLCHKIKELNLGAVEGYAVVNLVDGKVYSNYGGLAVFATEKDAQYVIDRWIKAKQVKKRRIAIKKVRISIEHGIEFLETINNHWVDPKTLEPEIDKDEAIRLSRSLEDLEKTTDNDLAKIAIRIAAHAIQNLNKIELPKGDEED